MGSDHSKISRENRRFKPSAPPASPALTACQQSGTGAPPPRPCPLTNHMPVSEIGTAAPKTTMVRASVIAPLKTTVRAPLAEPRAASVHVSMAAPQVTTVRASAASPQAVAVRASVAGPKKFTVRAFVTAPPEIKVLTSGKRCQICKKTYEESIFQCRNGHGACEVCFSLNLSCKLCIGVVKFIDTRHCVTKRLTKCPNNSDGCKLLLEKSEVTKHDLECTFKCVTCPAFGHCTWRGKISQLSTHFDEYHPSCRQANINTEMSLQNIYKEYNSLQLIKLGTFNFLLYIKVSELERKVYMDVQLVGSKLCASKWYYEIHIFNKMEPRRKHKCVNTCRSSSEAHGISILGCAVLPLTYVSSFTDKGTLTYKVFIKKNFNGF